MAANSTTLKAGDNLPPRGKSNKTRILNGIRQAAVMGVSEINTEGKSDYEIRELVEEKFWKYVATQAVIDEKNGAMLIKAMMDKGWASMKPTLGNVEFNFDEKLEPHEQALQVMAAAAKGEISPDAAQIFVASIANTLKIKEITDLEDRLSALEQVTGSVDA